MTHRDDSTAGWSTRELAELASTSVKAIRHYHQTGLLAEPERRENNYKVYRREHLERLLLILRMRDIGFSVAQIRESLESESSALPDATRLLAEVDESIERLQAVRADLVASLTSQCHWNAPPGFTAVEDLLSDADGMMARVMSRHLTREAMTALRSMSGAPAPIDAEFEQLPSDASDETIADLAARMAPHIRRAQARSPMPEAVVTGGRAAQERAAQAIGTMLSEVYSPAQLEVITRALGTDDGQRNHAD